MSRVENSPRTFGERTSDNRKHPTSPVVPTGDVGKAKTMKNGLLYWLLLTGLILVALGFIADKVDYCWQEETLAPPYRTVEMCVQLDRDLDHLMRSRWCSRNC